MVRLETSEPAGNAYIILLIMALPISILPITIVHSLAIVREVVGRIIRDMPRDEFIISTKAGFYMRDVPYV